MVEESEFQGTRLAGKVAIIVGVNRVWHRQRVGPSAHSRYGDGPGHLAGAPDRYVDRVSVGGDR
jgi:hypothetical protein